MVTRRHQDVSAVEAWRGYLKADLCLRYTDSGYRQDSSSGANANEQPYYPPPQSPPPAANSSTAHYAPPPGPPPAQNSYDPTNVQQK